jgi:hypothetical protein
MIRTFFTVATVAATLGVGGSALADEAHRLQGLFCNTEAQIDQALAGISAGVTPTRAAELANHDGVVCTHVDRIEYLIVRPAALGNPVLPLVKYRGVLVGVLVGDTLRPVTPEVELYFLTPRQITGAVIERRT